MVSFSSKFTRVLNSEDPPECVISLCSEVRTPLELKLIEILRTKLIPDPHEEVKQRQNSLAEKLLALEKIHVAFINDFGFYAGAGIATARQACSFALAGHQVSVVGLHPYPETVLGKSRYNKWLKKSGTDEGSIRYYASTLSDLDIARNGDKDHRRLIEELLQTENWDLVILGNLHSDAISLSFLNPIFQRKIPIIWYAHDLDLMGGGCGYPQYYNCTQYETKCLDSSCPRPKSQYPCSANGRVERSYVLRTLVHEYSNIYIACNSYWSQVQLAKRYPRRPILKIPYGIDTSVFFPTSDRAALRKELGLDPFKFTIVVGSDSVGRPGKGGEILDALIPAILKDADCQVISFGDYPNRPPGVAATGYLDNEISIARVFASGDCFLNPVTIEAFGQTLLEASACGCVPVILEHGGGVVDIVEDGRTGLVASDAEGLKSAIRRLKANKDLLYYLAKEGQEHIHREFSLERQYYKWVKTLTSEWIPPKALTIPTPQECNQTTVPFVPQVSIVSVTLNCAESIRTTAATLAIQDLQSFEWIIQDGGSTDQTLETAQTSGVPCLIDQEEDSGIYDAMNKAVRRCTADWVLFLHAGDWLAGPGALMNIMKTAETAAADLIVSDYIDILVDGSIIRRSPANPVQKLQALRDGTFQKSNPHWLSGMPCHQGTLTRRNWLEKFPFDPALPISADWFQMFSMIHAGAHVVKSPEILSWYPNGGYSYEHSDQWIGDTVKIAKFFASDHTAVDNYFSEALDEHQEKCLERRYRKMALKRFHEMK